MCFQFAISIFFITEKQSENKILNYNNEKAKTYVKKHEQCCVMSCHQDIRLTKKHLPLILYSSTSTEGPAASSSSPAPIEILSLGVLRSTVAPAKS